MSKNSKQLNSFTKYCKKHPEERFWQCLRNWDKAGFILRSNVFDIDMFDNVWVESHPEFDIKDTFYKDGLDNILN